MACRGKAEQYYKEVGTTPRLQTRLQTFHYKLVYQGKVEVFEEGIKALDAAVAAVTYVSPQALSLVDILRGHPLISLPCRANCQPVQA